MALSVSTIAGVVGLLAVVLANVYVSQLPSFLRSRLLRLQFLLCFTALLGIGSNIIWKTTYAALERTRLTRPRSRLLSLGFLALFLFISNSSFLFGLLLVGTEPHWYVTFSYICLGIYVHLIFAVLFIKSAFYGLQLLAWLGMLKLHQRLSNAKASSTTNFFPSRMGRVMLICSFAYALCMGFYGLHQAWQPPQITNVTVDLPKFPAEMSGFKVLLITDIHIGLTRGKVDMELLINTVQPLKADMIVVVGDLADSSVHNLKEAVEPIGKLQAPKGKYFVSGNHEYLNFDVENWFEYLQQLGFTILHNSNVIVTGDQSGQFCLAGVDDIDGYLIMRQEGHTMDLQSAVDGCDQSFSIVLLAHQPRAAKQALDSHHKIQLVLSGHTHGGQLFPASLFTYFLMPFYAGLYEYKRGQVYVSQGAGYWGIPMRIASHSEINLITINALS